MEVDMSKQALTEREGIFMDALNEAVQNAGQNQVWLVDVSNNKQMYGAGVSGKVLSGVVSSLCSKGIISTYDDGGKNRFDEIVVVKQ